MKDIKGYEGLYGITSCGRVWSYRKKKFLKPFNCNCVIWEVDLCKDGKRKRARINELVADAYGERFDRDKELYREELYQKANKLILN